MHQRTSIISRNICVVGIRGGSRGSPRPTVNPGEGEHITVTVTSVKAWYCRKERETMSFDPPTRILVRVKCEHEFTTFMGHLQRVSVLLAAQSKSGMMGVRCQSLPSGGGAEHESKPNNYQTVPIRVSVCIMHEPKSPPVSTCNHKNLQWLSCSRN